MSGHNKWSQIKFKKAISDSRKGKLFSKLATQISLAAKNGSDPAMNSSLRLIMETARKAEMPRENIDRAIKRGAGLDKDHQLKEYLYEAYGPAGVALLIEVITDNQNRAVAEIRAVLAKNSGKLAESGTVSYLFEKKGAIVIAKNEVKEDPEELEFELIDIGLEDWDENEENYFIYCAPANIAKIASYLKGKSIILHSQKTIYEPKTTTPVNEVNFEKIIKLLEALEDIEDVQQAYANFEKAE